MVGVCLALAGAPPARAQAGFPIPVPSSVVLVPLLLLAVPIGIELSRSDASRVRWYESRRDWRGLVDLATRELERHPGDPRWQSVRGRAWQRLGYCEPALQDLRPLVAASAPPAVDMPPEWRPAIDEAIRLCEAWLSVQHEAPSGSPVLLRLGGRSLSLPGAGWVPAPSPEWPPVRGASALSMLAPGGGSVVAVEARAAWAAQSPVPGSDATTDRVSAALVWAGNPRQAFGVQVWRADEPCGRRVEALHMDRYGSGFDAPECLIVRRTGPDGPASSAFASIRAEAAARGARWPEAGYEIRYDRYGLNWMISLQAWIAADRLPGEALAVMWSRVLAERLHPMGEPPEAQAVELPPLGH